MPQLDLNKRWLYKRLKGEDRNNEPYFAFQGTVNWMRALAILCEREEFSPQELAAKYAAVQRRSHVNWDADASVFQFTFMSFQNLSALNVMVEVGYPSDLVRSAIVAWYYGLYYSASAMLAAADGSVQEDHRGTANSWNRQIAHNALIPFPFNLRVTSLIKKDYEEGIQRLRNGNLHDIHNLPTDEDEAFGACISYLTGTAQYERERAEKRIRSHKEFKELGVKDFRTNAARKVRDNYLGDKKVGFLHQAFRYRGKANYRDALYLGYGTEYTTELEQLLQDLHSVLKAFVKASTQYCCRRVEKNTWKEFVQDLKMNSRLKLSVDVLRV